MSINFSYSLISFKIFLLTVIVFSNTISQVKNGYYLVQSISTFRDQRFGSLSISNEKDKLAIIDLFKNIKQSDIDGVEYETVWFDSIDIEMHKRIAHLADSIGVDVWESDWRISEKIKDHAFGIIPDEYRAFTLKEDGSIVPTTDSNGKYYLDVLNPNAIHWLLDETRSNSYGAYLKNLDSDIKGYIFDETRLLSSTSANVLKRPIYHHIPVYSESNLSQWKEYCKIRNILDSKGQLIDKFPVHKPEMELSNPQKLIYVEGCNENVSIARGKTFSDMPKDYGVWKDWYEFLTTLFAKNYLKTLAELVESTLQKNENWHGIIYFQNIPWGLDYSDSLLKDINIPLKENNTWGAWSYSFGVDLKKVCSIKEIKYIVAESYPPTLKQKKDYFSVYSHLVRSANKYFGMLVHNDHGWKYSEEEEKDRWNSINTLNPTIIVRYPRVPVKKYFSPYKENDFELQAEKRINDQFRDSLSTFRKKSVIGTK